MNIDNDNSRTVYAITAMTLTNIAGDFYVVLFTNAGIFGLALATSFSNFICFAVFALHFLREKRILRLNFKTVKNFPTVFLNIFRQGSMSAFTRLSKSLAGILINHIILFYATSYELAAYGVQNQIINLFRALYLGTADTILVMSRVYYGEEDRKSLDDLQVSSMITGITLTVICSILMFTFSEFFAGLYLGRENPQVLSMGSEAVKYLAIAMPLYVFIFGFVNYLQGVKRFFAANTFIVIIQLVIPMVTTYTAVKYVNGMAWRAAPYGALLLALLCVGYIMIQKVPVNFKKRLLLNKNFYDSAAEELELAADSELEVIGMSRMARLFCLENNFSEKIALRLSLCIEELGMNILRHGFNDGKEHYIYLRILAKEDKIILRIRDDCVAFNPLEYYEMTSRNEDDPAKNIGIRLIVKMCSDIIYLSMFRTNNLIITIPKEQTESQAVCKFVDNFSDKALY